MNLFETLNSIEDKIPKEDIFKEVLSKLAEENYFTVLKDNDYFTFHQKIIKLSSHPHGPGIGLSVMAQINIAGNLLKLSANEGHEYSRNLLESVVKGESTISAGISEKGWKGRLSNLISSLKEENGKLIVNANKSFFTNGKNSSHYIILVRDEKKDFKLIVVPKETKGLSIKHFSLQFAPEATHCSINFENTEIEKEWILPLNYSGLGEELRLGEVLSLSAIYCGFLPVVFSYCAKEIQENFQEDTNWKKNAFDWWISLEMLKARIEKISGIKSSDQNFKHLEYFPFGLEKINEGFWSLLEGKIEKESLVNKFPDLGLFLWDDPLNHFLYSKRLKSFFKELLNDK